MSSGVESCTPDELEFRAGSFARGGGGLCTQPPLASLLGTRSGVGATTSTCNHLRSASGFTTPHFFLPTAVARLNFMSLPFNQPLRALVSSPIHITAASTALVLLDGPIPPRRGL